MKRPTIPDLAEAAGVSVSTVNRVLNRAETVRPPTRERVLQAAEDIGFYCLGTIEHAVRASQTTHRLGVLLQRSARRFYGNLGEAITEAARSHQGQNVSFQGMATSLNRSGDLGHCAALGVPQDHQDRCVHVG